MFFKKKNPDYKRLTGKTGVVETQLNPFGTVLIEDEVFNAAAEEDYVDAGRGVKVSRVRGGKIFVRRV